VRHGLHRETDSDIEDETGMIDEATLLAYSCCALEALLMPRGRNDYSSPVPHHGVYSKTGSGVEKVKVVVVLGDSDQDLRSPLFLGAFAGQESGCRKPATGMLGHVFKTPRPPLCLDIISFCMAFVIRQGHVAVLWLFWGL
jgi:hypothetical protein